MKPLLTVLKRNLFILGFFFISTVIIATNVTLILKKETAEPVKQKENAIDKTKTTNKKAEKKSTSAFRTLNYQQEATVLTDKPDYYPGDVVEITGSGWDAGEEVHLNIVSDCGCTNVTYVVYANEAGDIYNKEFLIQEWHIGVSFVLTATGTTHYAETTFTDSPKIVSVSVSTQDPDPVQAGTDATYVISVLRSNSNDAIDADLTISSLPAGITATFTPATISFPGGDPGATMTASLTLSSNACTTYDSPIEFTVTATKPRGQSENFDDNASGDGELNIVNDDDPPVITTSGDDLSLGCNPSASDIDAALGTATATDACTALTITASDGDVVSSSSNCSQSKTRTFMAKDGAGNTSTASRTATWTHDVTAPVVTLSTAPSLTTCNPGTADIDASLGTATATDACGIPTVTYSDGAISSSSCGRSQTRTFTAIDGCGNTSTTARTVNWTYDVTPPVLTLTTAPSLGTCNPAASDIDASLGTATATDACGIPTVTFSDGTITSSTCGRSQTRTFTATDGCGNTSTIARTVNWTYDVTPPVLSLTAAPPLGTCNPGTPDIDASLGTATATDVCGIPTVTYSDGVITSSTCGRSQTRTFTAIDGCGNTSTISRTVNWTYDVTSPSITLTAAPSLGTCNPSASDINASLGTATATDACSVPTITYSDGAISSSGCGRSQKRTFLATDACGNTSTSCRTVTWTYDVTGPTITLTTAPSLGSCNPGASDIDASLGTATATDACSVPTITFSDGTISSSGCSRSQKRTFTARDGCGNTSTSCRTVSWTYDVTSPALTLSTAPALSACNPVASDVDASLGTATATDACGVPTVTYSDGDVTSSSCSRSQKRTFTARDGCGNTSTICRTVTWTYDVTGPTFTGSYASATLGCNPAASDISAALGSATATDACSTASVISQSDGTITSSACTRSQRRTFTARDGCGNTSTACRTVTWTADLTPPVFTSTFSNTSLGCNPVASDIDAALGTATATDGCGVPTLSRTDALSGTCITTKTRTFTATDFCGNTSTASRSVTYRVDNGTPSIPVTFVSQTCLWPPNHKMVDIILGATDGCGVTGGYVRVTSNEPKNDLGDGNTLPDMDWNGAAEASSSPYIVQGPVTAGSDGKIHIQLRAERSGVQALVTPDIGRSYKIEFTATDGCGNTASATNTVTVAHNITNPKVGSSYKVGTTVSLGGTFWDIPGNTHTAKWLIDGTSVNGTIVSEPSGNKMGKAAGSYKTSAAGVFKLRMNITDQKGVTSYATTSGDYEAFLVVYDPNGGYTYGGGSFMSPAGAVVSNPNMTGKVAFGFASNYFKTATNPKGETELAFKVGSVEFNAVNYDVLSVDAAKSKATYKGLGKTIIDGVEQSGYTFLMVVIDGKTATNPNGVDKIRIKIYNKNTGAIIYDNQPGASDSDDPTTPVNEPMADGSDIVVVSTTTATSADLTRSSQMEVAPAAEQEFNVRVYPNPTEHEFTLYLEGGSNEKVQLVVYDAIGRQVKKIQKGDASGAIRFGEDLKVGAYIVEVRQGVKRKVIKLTKQ